MKLTINMRIALAAGEKLDEEEFANFLLDLGDGKIAHVSGPGCGEYAISLPDSFILPGNDLCNLVDWVYPHLHENLQNPHWLCERSILCPTNAEVDTVNHYVTEKFPGDRHDYFSTDSLAADDNSFEIPVEYLNTLCPSGMPPHRISLKIGMIIMLLRNFDQIHGHCNGSRYIVRQLLLHLVVAELVSGVHAGRQLLIPRISISPSEKIFPFTMIRRQFPIRPCFAMTVNKSQGQSLHRVGVYTVKDFFSHGQFYVTASRVGSARQLKILAVDAKDTSKRSVMNNVVYTEVLTT
ncbi:PREDICTED: ATP-dependent DNA helicase pif1-like [Priapulus caudatus]|uniref:ATP-dependent DNA helicase pif1-like n=1 Tax=Priapulus caudatus TaxID=37621 RepID=A0ABM1ERC4_PRICU|nr:PREDICTED: ATP-dependent DNA helicase pif1-like [Priapulus caudatus]